jgi:hypothetical protein
MEIVLMEECPNVRQCPGKCPEKLKYFDPDI